MSFDLKLNKGTIIIGSNGDLDIVEDSDKLIQDILKILMTPIGSNVFFSWYGSLLTESSIGEVLDSSLTLTVIKEQIRNSLEMLQKLQKQQAIDGQRQTAGELLAAIQEVLVNRSIVDPTEYQLSINVVSKAFKTETATLNINI